MTTVSEENAVLGRQEDVTFPDDLSGYAPGPYRSTSTATLAPPAPPAPRHLSRTNGPRHAASRWPAAFLVWWAVVAVGLVAAVLVTAVLVAGGTAGGHAQASASAHRTAPHTATAPSAQVAPSNATAKALAALAGPAGPSWSVTQTYGPSAYSLTAVACPSTAQCVAVGETTFKTGMDLTSSDGGATWTQHPVPAGVGTLSAISCPTVNTCTAVGGNSAISTTDGGTTWTAASVDSTALTAVSCPTVGECVAAGSGPAGASGQAAPAGCQSGATYTSTDSGRTWTTTPTPCFVPAGIDCSSLFTCVAVGTHASGTTQAGEIQHSGDGGHTWESEYVMSGGNTGLGAVSCPSVRVCVAAGNSPTQAIVRTADGGFTWARQVVHGTASRSYFLALSCASETVCQAAGAGFPVSTGDAGATWSPRGSSNDITKILGISCPSESSCVGVAWDSLAVPATIKLS